MILKILRHKEWQTFQQNGFLKGTPIDLADGFIHFSTPAQVAETAAKHFAQEENLFLVAVDPESLGEALKWEVSRNGELFPHLYAPLKARQVIWSAPLLLGDNSKHLFPENIPI